MARSLAATLSPLIAAVAFLALSAQAPAQDEHGVVGWEVFTTETPGGGGKLTSTGLNGAKTNFPKGVAAPTTAGTAVTNMTVQYWHCAKCHKNPKDPDGKAGGGDAKGGRKSEPKKDDPKKKPEPPNCPTFDPRFYELDKDGKVVPKKDAPPHIIKQEPPKLWDGPPPHPVKDPPPTVESGPTKKADPYPLDPYRRKDPPPNVESGPKKFEDSVLDPYRGHMWCPRPAKFECGAHYEWWLKNHQHMTEPRKSWEDSIKNSPTGNHILITGTVVEGQETTVTAVDARGSVITGAVIELPDGSKVTTDNNGQAKFMVPSGLAALTLAMGGSEVTSWIWPKGSNLPTQPMMQLPKVIDQSQHLTIGGANLPANGQILVDGIPATTLASSPTGMIVELPKNLPAGEHSLALIENGKVLDVQTTDGVNLVISQPKTLVKGQKATFEVIIEGTEQKVTVEVMNGSMGVVALQDDAADGMVVSSGGQRNIAKVVVKAVGAGALALPCRVQTSFLTK